MSLEGKRTLYIDCFSGIAGDMMLGALLDLGAPKSALDQVIEALGLSQVELHIERSSVQGISGTDVHVLVGGRQETTSHHNPEPHSHSSNETGHGTSIRQIRSQIEEAPLEEQVKSLSLQVFTKLAQAEGKIHGCAAEDVHLHEVGAADALVDIVGCAALLHALEVGRVIASPVPLGHGFTRCAHGRIPIPVPATVEILRGVPTRDAGIEAELVTPTGAALLTTLASSFGGWPEMTIDRTGYGLGDARWPDRPNMLRLVLGEQAPGIEATEVTLLEANLDDMNPEWFSPLFDALLEANALDVWLTPIQMKKGRPATKLSALSASANAQQLARLITTHSTTLGVRMTPVSRFTLDRKSVAVSTSFGSIEVKLGLDGDRIVNAAPEFTSCRDLAARANVPLKQIYQAAQAAIVTAGLCPQSDASHTPPGEDQ